jgi:hypothetical protein
MKRNFVTTTSAGLSSSSTLTTPPQVNDDDNNKNDDDDEYDYSSIPPENPLSIITPPSHVITSSLSSSPKTTPSVTQQIQHTLKKNLSIAYQQNIIIQSETLFQAAMQQSLLPYVP